MEPVALFTTLQTSFQELWRRTENRFSMQYAFMSPCMKQSVTQVLRCVYKMLIFMSFKCLFILFYTESLQQNLSFRIFTHYHGESFAQG